MLIRFNKKKSWYIFETGRTKTENSLGFSESSDTACPVSTGKCPASAERESFSKLQFL